MGEKTELEMLLRSFGVSRTCAGWRYLICALEQLREDPEGVEQPTKRVYPGVARRFGVTPGGVDSALRTAMHRSLSRVPERFDHVEGRLTVSEFLRTLRDADIYYTIKKNPSPVK